MPQDIKIWEISEGGELNQIDKSKLDLEQRLEDWIEKDISIISNDLLIIGRQVQTDFGKDISKMMFNLMSFWLN